MLYFGRSEFQFEYYGIKSRCLQSCVPCGVPRRQSASWPFPCTVYLPWVMASSSFFKGYHSNLYSNLYSTIISPLSLLLSSKHLSLCLCPTCLPPKRTLLITLNSLIKFRVMSPSQGPFFNYIYVLVHFSLL